MTLKIMACGVLVLCGWRLGWEGKRKLTVRSERLEWFRALFLEMRGMVAHNGLTLNEMIAALWERHPEARFLRQLQDTLAQAVFATAWTKTLYAQKDELCLSMKDIQLLSDCAALLGKNDVDGELRTFALIDERLSRACDESRLKMTSDGSVYIAIGSSCGVILALLLL
ncbi:MAG: stage III sporulation protein AB [Clostridia bacterium]|nr:stage III sporulation protein AB [Clostridia bacterium]